MEPSRLPGVGYTRPCYKPGGGNRQVSDRLILHDQRTKVTVIYVSKQGILTTRRVQPWRASVSLSDQLIEGTGRRLFKLECNEPRLGLIGSGRWHHR